MKAVATLLRIHFTGSAVRRMCTIAGLCLTMLGMLGMACFPSYRFSGPRSSQYAWDGAIAFSFLLGATPVVGIITLFFGGGLMPTIFMRLTRGRQLPVLPHGHARLLTSAFLVILTVAAAFAAVIKVLYIGYPIDQGQVVAKALVVSFLTFAIMYGLLWLVGQARSALMLLSGTMLLLPCLLLPFRYTYIPSPSIRAPLSIGIVLLGTASIVYLRKPRWRWVQAYSAIRAWRRRFLASRPTGRQGYGLFLRLPHPLMLAIGQTLPIGLASIYITAPSVWLFYFALCSLIGGASASLAAPRSRPLWLLLPCTREQLYRLVESAYWRQNAYGAGALVILLIALGSMRQVEAQILLIGIPLLLVGITAGTYLGMMMTGPLRALDACFAVAAMLLMLGLAYFADRVNSKLLALGIGLLTLATLAFREISRRRWRRIDWAVNRPARMSQ